MMSRSILRLRRLNHSFVFFGWVPTFRLRSKQSEILRRRIAVDGV